ncbi:glyoxalase, partial [candidate division KSB1 bacterium]|nr:glyoxalase [candidate division KSB1 bacterium]
MKILLTSILVDDPIKAHEFYTEILGFQSKEFTPEA